MLAIRWSPVLLTLRVLNHTAALSGSRATALKERDGLKTYYLEPLATPDILAPDQVISAHHIALRLRKPSPVAFIGAPRNLALFPAHNPADLVIAGLAAVRTSQRVRSLLRPLVKKVPLFHA